MEEKNIKDTKPQLDPKTQKTIRMIKIIEKYSLYIGIIAIFVAIAFPVINYVSTAAFALTYVTALIKQRLQNGKIKFISFLLCSASLTWVILRQFNNSPYVLLFGQMILYAYLMVSQKELLGQVKKSFIAFAVSAVGLGILRIYYPSPLTNGLNLVMQLWILYRFLDPILEKIGQAHRKKRLEAEAENRRREQEEQAMKDTAEKVEESEAEKRAEEGKNSFEPKTEPV